jgi:plasmid stability protein
LSTPAIVPYDIIAGTPRSDVVPTTLHVRNLDEDTVARLKRRAARHGRSAEAEHREILRVALSGETDRVAWEDLAARVRSLSADRAHTPSEVLQREGRDER